MVHTLLPQEFQTRVVVLALEARLSNLCHDRGAESRASPCQPQTVSLEVGFVWHSGTTRLHDLLSNHTDQRLVHPCLEHRIALDFRRAQSSRFDLVIALGLGNLSCFEFTQARVWLGWRASCPCVCCLDATRGMVGLVVRFCAGIRNGEIYFALVDAIDCNCILDFLLEI